MPDGPRCPQCDSPLSFWATRGAPFSRISCPRCKSVLKYQHSTQQAVAMIGAWFVALAGSVIVIVLLNAITWFILAIVVPRLIIDIPANAYFRKNGTLEVLSARK